jgi:hypothetical protein
MTPGEHGQTGWMALVLHADAGDGYRRELLLRRQSASGCKKRNS